MALPRPTLSFAPARTHLHAGPLYFGNTLWCSYSLHNYQPCGYGFGPLQAAGAKKAECPKLPNGGSAIGPFPYAAGLMWGMSYDLIEWIAGSRLVNDFAHNASSHFEPPYWVKGEDSAFGLFAHIAPFPNLTPIHCECPGSPTQKITPSPLIALLEPFESAAERAICHRCYAATADGLRMLAARLSQGVGTLCTTVGSSVATQSAVCARMPSRTPPSQCTRCTAARTLS